MVLDGDWNYHGDHFIRYVNVYSLIKYYKSTLIKNKFKKQTFHLLIPALLMRSFLLGDRSGMGSS